jgi:hypothetical protein
MIVAAVLISGSLARESAAAVGQGAAALLSDDVSGNLKLTENQIQQIESIRNAALKKCADARNAKQGQQGLKDEIDRIRQAGQDQAVALLTPEQKKIWHELAGPVQPIAKTTAMSAANAPASDAIASRSLIIPSIQELKHPPSRNAYGPNASIVETRPHPPLGEAYVVLTDHTDPVALAALDRLAKHRHGIIVRTGSLGELYQFPAEFTRLQQELRKLKPRYVAIAPRPESYRENMHLCMLKLLSSLDDKPGLDVFPGYLVGGDAAQFARLVDRTIAFKPIMRDQVKPVSIGTLEDDGDTRYRSYQKAKVLQNMFTTEGVRSPAIFTVTNPTLEARADFPKFDAGAGEIVMRPSRRRQPFQELSDAAKDAMQGRNVLFMFGHGMPDRLCGTKVSAFAPLSFLNELVFCGSCMSASPSHADRADLERQASIKRFGTQAIENGAVMVLGHMGMCGGFPEVFPVAEHTFEGLSVGEAYQRVMNALMGSAPLPDYYSSPPSKEIERRDAANNLLLILWADPALVPIKS